MEEGGDDKEEDYNKWSSVGDDSGMSSTGDNKYSTESVEGSDTEEDGGGWSAEAQCCG